ncbi:MAG: hypothetical protein P8H44_03570 [Flavobacteriaceae bacterium]|nr:hypothetical protein [Flavobacteriaceae bacterium]MDG1793613.1 hypothetical protein [Flavobacteriaceae bacterium]
MKKIIFVISVITLCACSGGDDNNSSGGGDDNNSASSNNLLVVDGVEYPLKSGTLLNYGGQSGLYNIDLDIYTLGIDVPDCTEGAAVGQGQNIYFEMWTSEPDFLDSITYSIDEDESEAVGNITVCDYILDFDSNVEDNNWTIISSGNVDVVKSGNNYTITWNLTGLEGEAITGRYSGTLMYCDISN